MSFVGTANCVVFDVFPAKTKSAGVVIDELTGTIEVDLGLFVGEGSLNVLWSGLGKERFANLSLII